MVSTTEKCGHSPVSYTHLEGNPVYLADKPKRPLRIPVWLEREEQARLESTLKDRRNIPINVFGDNQKHMTATRRRYEMLFGLLLNSGPVSYTHLSALQKFPAPDGFYTGQPDSCLLYTSRCV